MQCLATDLKSYAFRKIDVIFQLRLKKRELGGVFRRIYDDSFFSESRNIFSQKAPSLKSDRVLDPSVDLI